MYVTVFRSRLRPGVEAEYRAEAEKMLELASAMPGFSSFKTFSAEDGERVSLVEFDSEETLRAWREHPEHRRAQQLGRERFYSEYAVQVCKQVRNSKFEAPSAPSTGSASS